MTLQELIDMLNGVLEEHPSAGDRKIVFYTPTNEGGGSYTVDKYCVGVFVYRQEINFNIDELW